MRAAEIGRTRRGMGKGTGRIQAYKFQEFLGRTGAAAISELLHLIRSEERRVGKECLFVW